MADVHALAARAPSPNDARRASTQPAYRSAAPAGPAVRLPDATVHGRNILVCLDRSKQSEVCLPHAVALARTLGSAVTLVHVMQSRSDHAGQQAADALGWEISRKEAQAYIERLEKQVSTALGRPIAVRLEQGRPAERIVDLAQEVAADLTVLGSRGEGGGSALTLGSTVQQVLALARSSVFVAHSSPTAQAVVAPRRILVPLDGSLRSESVLPTVARIAGAHDAEILLVHIVQEPLPTALLRDTDDMAFARRFAQRLEAGARRYLDELEQQLAREVTSVRTLVVRHPNQYRCLLEISQRESTDLIVLSAHGAGCDSTHSFGSVTGYLLTHSMVPLLVLQDLPASELSTSALSDASLAPPSLRASYAPGTV